MDRIKITQVVWLFRLNAKTRMTVVFRLKWLYDFCLCSYSPLQGCRCLHVDLGLIRYICLSCMVCLKMCMCENDYVKKNERILKELVYSSLKVTRFYYFFKKEISSQVWRYMCLSPLSELLEDDAVGESLSADANPLKNSITPQLVQNQVRLQFTCLKKKQRAVCVCSYFSTIAHSQLFGMVTLMLMTYSHLTQGRLMLWF